MAAENPFAQLFKKPSTTVQLAVLLAGSKTEDIQISITNIDPTATSYTCISYDRSGESQDATAIQIVGEPMNIPRHLETALLELRDRHTPRTLWADLIAGSNDEERSAQAATTKTVITNADQVIIWLGSGNEHSATAFDIIQNMANRWQQACLHTRITRKISTASAKQLTEAREFLLSKNMDDLHGDNTAAWREVQSILTSSYFKSVQSIPEVLLARKVAVRCGQSTVDWSDFVRASTAASIFITQQFNMQICEGFIEGFQRISSLDIALRRKSDGETLELLPMIHAARDCSPPDPREVVFSMLPIITPSARQPDNTRTEPPPVADYSKSASEVFADAARYIIHERQDLLLWWNESPPRRRKVHGIPSWVPDWTSPLPDGTIKIIPDSTCGLRDWWDHIHPALLKRINVVNKSLHVQAHVLDRVEHVSEMFTADNCRRLCLTLFQRLRSLPNELVEAKCKRIACTILLNQAGMGSTLRENAVPTRDVWMSFQSMIAEERILEVLNCTSAELMARPDMLRHANHPDIAIMGPLTGRSGIFETLLRRNALGRCYFVTKNGRTGMTALQTLPPRHEGDRQMPDFSESMADPLGRSMLEAFQAYVRQHQPQVADPLADALAGRMPGQAPQGVRSGDLVVALIGGFQPYVLRPHGEFAAQPEVDGSDYEYVGDCYLHGVMDGEPFKNSSGSFNRDVKLVNITIS